MIMANTNSSSNGSLLSGETKKELLPPTSTSVSNLTSISQTTVSESIKTESSTLTTTTTTPKTTTTPAPAAINTSGAPPPQPAHLSNSDIRWIFSLDKIEQSPSRLDGVSRESELQERQEAALFINDLGIKLKVNQLCINTAIIYMHRFFMIHSLKKFHHYVRIVATSCLFFACKVEEQPRRLREFIDIVQSLFHKSNEPINHNSEEYRHYGDQIMALESCLIQTLGFNVLINHAHTVIIKTCQMIKAPRDLAEAAYLTATNSLILTDFCVKFSSEKVACFCIYLACKWTGLIIPMSSEGMQWYEYVNHDIKEQELEDISKEYLSIYGKVSSKIKKKLGITKSHDEINPQLHPKHQGHQQQVRKPMPASQQHPNPRPNNPNQAPQSNVNKQHSANQPSHHPSQQKTNHSNTQQQQNGYHSQQPNQSNYHYVNQQQQRQQHYQQQQARSGPNPKSNQPQNPQGPGANSHPPNYPNSNKNIIQSSSKNNPTNNTSYNANSANNRYNYPNGNLSATSTSQSHPGQNLAQQSGASSSNNTKSNISLNLSGNQASGHPNGNGNPMKKSQPPNNTNQNPNYKQINGTNNSNNSLNLYNSSNSNRSSPSNPVSNSSMKRGNEEITNNVSTAPNKIPKYVIDQKSAS